MRVLDESLPFLIGDRWVGGGQRKRQILEDPSYGREIAAQVWQTRALRLSN